MRILHINQQNTKGGAAAIANCLVKKLNEGGITSELWYFNKKGEDANYSKCIYPLLGKFKDNDILNKIIKKVVYLHSLYQGDVWNPFFNNAVKRVIKWKPDIIHLHNLHGGWVDLRLIAKLSEKTQVVITLHDEWLITGHCGYSLGCLELNNSCSKCPDLVRYVPLKRPITKRLKREKEKFLLTIAKNGAILVTPSKWLKQQFAISRMWNGKDIIVIPNGIDVTSFDTPGTDKIVLRRELGFSEQEKVALFVADGGIRNIWKGFDILRKALQLLPRSKGFMLVVAGNNKDDIGTENINSVILKRIGYLSRELLQKYYSVSDVLIYPTKADNCSLVLLESMSMGLPIITTSVGGNSELINDKSTGILVLKDNPDLLMKAILDFIDNKYNYNQIGTEAKNRAVFLYASEIMCSKYQELYTRLVNRRPD